MSSPYSFLTQKVLYAGVTCLGRKQPRPDRAPPQARWPPRRGDARHPTAQRVDGCRRPRPHRLLGPPAAVPDAAWTAGNWCNGGYDGELFNEVLLPFLEAIPQDQAAEIALKSAEEVDAFLLTVPDEVVEAALARPDRPNLDRGSHREGHLDQIEKALAG